MRLAVIALTGLLVWLGWLSSHRAEADPRKFGNIPVAITGCNSIAFAQVPGHPDLFLGRALNNTNPADKCSGHSWSLTYLRMNWKTHKLALAGVFVQTPLRIAGGLTAWNAFDPSVADFNGEYLGGVRMRAGRTARREFLRRSLRPEPS